MKTVSEKLNSGLSSEDILAAVERDSKGQMDIESRLAKNDTSVAFDLIAVAIYKAMRRRGVPHVKALKSTQELIFITNIKAVIR